MFICTPYACAWRFLLSIYACSVHSIVHSHTISMCVVVWAIGTVPKKEKYGFIDAIIDGADATHMAGAYTPHTIWVMDVAKSTHSRLRNI